MTTQLKYPEPDYCMVCGGIQFGIHYHDLPDKEDDDEELDG
jgi:hypothetical protein